MRFQAVFYFLGRLLLIICIFLFIPAFVSLYYGEKEIARHFLQTAGIALGLGFLLAFLCRHGKDQGLAVRDGFLLVTLTWLSISFLGALPFYFSGFMRFFADAFFESVSGFTTTGASVVANIEAMPQGLLFWRNFTQWIGGMGIIVLSIAILPQLSVGGMQLMKNEMPGPTFEQLKPRIKQTAMSLWKIYVLLSAMEIVALYYLGMPLFDSVLHMFGTMATGGFSPRNASVVAYQSSAIEMVICLFMFLAGVNFVLHYAVIHGNPKKMLRDTEWRFYVGLTVVCLCIVAGDLFFQLHYPVLKSLRLAVFQVVSITTTTGFVTADFDVWGPISKSVLFLLMFVGGCAGSTGGGLKQIRVLLLFKRAKQAIVQHVFPKAIVSVKVNKSVIPESVLLGVSSFFLIYIVIYAICVMPLLAFHLDVTTATSAVAACLGNVGPGLGLVGATQNYAFLPGVVKMILCACMILGRLEIFTVLVLFFPATWRR
ncbi:MAG: TrkH family potassium uptake protein [Candidatus Omnitrophica bacterium]|nr:TrkH family potassium uptake protein [Candidatus Omnitrophota bacterium]